MEKSELLCSRCGGKPVFVIVDDEPLCQKHRVEWLIEESKFAAEEQVCRVMKAIDAVLDEEITEWDAHLRKLAIAAIEAAA